MPTPLENFSESTNPTASAPRPKNNLWKLAVGGVVLAALLIVVVFLVQKNLNNDDPFDGLNVTSFSTQGKVIEVKGQTFKIEAAESSKVGDSVTIKYVEKSVTYNDQTKFYNVTAGTSKSQGSASDVMAGAEIVVTGTQNPNASNNLAAQEITVLK